MPRRCPQGAPRQGVSSESPGDPFRAEVRQIRLELGWWLGPDHAKLAHDLVLNVFRRYALAARRERLGGDPQNDDQLNGQIEHTRRLLDRAVTVGLEQRVGYRLGSLDRELLRALRRGGAGPPGGGVAVCQDCICVFRPTRKSAAKRCDKCHRHPPPPWFITHERLEWPAMRFASTDENGERVEVDQHTALASLDEPLDPGEVSFSGWTVQCWVMCHECGQLFQASDQRAVTCSPGCKSARKRRRDGGDTDEYGAPARELRKRIDELRR